MMATLLKIIISSILLLYSIPKLSGQSSPALNTFLERFHSVVQLHDESAMMELMDADYKKQQWKKFLDKRTKQFLKEFFCGTIESSGEFECFDFGEISGLEIVTVSPGEETIYVTYFVSSGLKKIKTSWMILAKKKGKEIIYGFVGASG